MCLQKRDYQTANQLQKELAKKLPGDKAIQEFANYLHQEAQAQKKELEGQEESEYDSEYDDEDEDEEEAEEEVEEEEVEEEKPAEDEEEYEPLGDPGSDYEWASDVDSNGKIIWGEEGVDYTWYHQEDKEAYERGESMIPDILLNKNQIA